MRFIQNIMYLNKSRLAQTIAQDGLEAKNLIHHPFVVGAYDSGLFGLRWFDQNSVGN
jgi:hypothetical protein